MPIEHKRSGAKTLAPLLVTRLYAKSSQLVDTLEHCEAVQCSRYAKYEATGRVGDYNDGATETRLLCTQHNRHAQSGVNVLVRA